MSGHVIGTECALVDRCLDDWAAGQSPAAVARRIEAHLAVCERCSRLAAIVRGDDEATEASADDFEIVTGVLQHTTGSPCTRAEELLPDLVDGEIGADDQAVLTSHLAHCEPCRRVLAALREADDVLPTLAEMQPPSGFVEGVLRATSARAARPAFAGARSWQRPPALAWQWLGRLVARPRASLELAYVATVLLVIVFGNPVAAFHDAEARASQLAISAPVSRLTQDLPIKQAATGTIARLLTPLGRAVNAVATELTARLREVRALAETIATSVGRSINWLATIDLKTLVRSVTETVAPRGQPQATPAAAGATKETGRK